MRTHAFLVINPSSGDDSPSAGELAEAARGRGVEAHVLGEGEDPGEVARAASAEIVGMADRDAPVAALAAFRDGVERRVDVGRVNGRLFLNNVSLGVYAGLVHRREHHRRRGEALARIRGVLAVAQHRHRLRLRVNGEELVARVLLIGNNHYELSLFTLGERERLDRGELQLWAAAGVFPTAWEERIDARFTIELGRGTVRAAIDGEPVVLEQVLEVESLPGALRVLLPVAQG
jgi:diacylglycerol kinase family enzyme